MRTPQTGELTWQFLHRDRLSLDVSGIISQLMRLERR